MAKLSKEQKFEIINLVKQGYKTKAIATRFNVEPAAISYIKDQYIIHGEKLFTDVLKQGRNIETEDQKLIKLQQKKIEELELVNEHQKKFKAFVEEARKKETIK
ncbi:helix-turn-helix domain-containing protein [Spiroplasma eriocheiris]|uniref:Uncharacterized protein n=1 Tax=Spiroplasma eriocheiris TaxID=315358 RepID=A0A0H3XHT4_9MOLU|nr:helix-turn-helix domain-containing protein [Spiroplasma eriocheiris]AHF57899.1 hypothetical protein SPE_0777 [Spiroplasma eriocheiris CCTCC M 207170]AKM54343.1 hypothetical protein SERIO_v1c07810 [Spiroplasma eriocheiris]